MSRFILDTNALISIIENKNQKMLKRLNEAILVPDDISTTILNYYEFLRGLNATTNTKHRKDLKKYMDKIITVINTINSEDADRAAGIYQNIQKKNKVGKRKTPPSDVDIIMTAIALSVDATIVSHDGDFFLMGVKVQNWEH